MSDIAVFFVSYNPDELAVTPDYEPAFRPGDLLLIQGPADGMSDGIIVRRFGSRVTDLVWPEEVAA